MTMLDTHRAPRVLITSIAFPPKFDSESLQVEKIMAELVDSGAYRLSVLTTDRNGTRNMPLSTQMRDFRPYCEAYLELPLHENRYVTKALSMIGLANLPDTKSEFHRCGVAAAFAQLPEPDLIYARSFPPSSNVLAMKLAVAWQKPWIMHLSDPWSLSPLLHFSPLERWYARRMERRCLASAAAVSFTTPETLALYARHYPTMADKFFLTHNAVRADAIRSAPRASAPGDVLTIVHTGVLNENRDPTALMQGLRALFVRRPELRGKIRLRICGPADRHVQRLMRAYDDVVEHAGIIQAPEDFKAFVDSGDLLLAVDMRIDDPTRDVYLISKLLDYAGNRQNILCITNPGSPAQAFVAEVGGRSFGWDDGDALQAFLEQAHRAKAAGDSAFFAAKPLPSRYTSANVAAGVQARISTVLEGVS